MTNDIPQSLHFSDVAIVQEKNKALSRLDVNLSSEIIRGVVRPSPLIAANMSTVTNAFFYKELYKLGGMAFLHRAQSIQAQCEEIKEVAKDCEWVGFSIGVGADYKSSVNELFMAGGNVCLIDIAHGYSDTVIELGRWIKTMYPEIKVVVGNTNNVKMMEEIADFADGLKIGIGQGKACRTMNTAGCTEGQFTTVLKFKEISKKYGIPIISCGGIREAADVVKAVGAGANGVMIGSVFAACPESAAPIKNTLDGKFKVYAGMASSHVQKEWKGGLKDNTCAEGDVVLLPISQPVEQVVQHYTGALRSGITYSGSLSIPEFQKNVSWVRI